MTKFEGFEPQPFMNNSDIAIDKESGLAIVVIKPDAFKNRDQIIKRLEGSGLYIVKTVKKRLPDDFVIGAMYPKDLKKEMAEQTLRHFNSGPSEIILLRGGDNMVQDLVTLVGEKTNPAECNEDSIRYIFGEHFGRKVGDETFHYNAAHRAKNQKEREEDLDKFESFL